MSTREVELKYLIAHEPPSSALPPPLPPPWSYVHPEPTRELLTDEYLDDDRATIARLGLRLRRRVSIPRDSDRRSVQHADPVTTYWLKGREPAEGSLHSRLEREITGLDDPVFAAASGGRFGAEPSLKVQALLRQERDSWIIAHSSGRTGSLSIDQVSGSLLGVELSWGELEVEIHAPESEATNLAADLDESLKALSFLTPSTQAKFDRAMAMAKNIRRERVRD